MPYERPPYPKVLTVADWRSHQNILVKLAVKTGMPDELDLVEKAYNAVRWDKIEIGVNPPKFNAFVMSEWDKKLEAANDEVESKVSRLVTALGKLEKAAQAAALTCRGKKLVPASVARRCDDIALGAKGFAGVFDNDDISATLAEDHQAVIDRMLSIADGFPKLLKATLTKTPAALKKLKADPTPENFNSECHLSIRDITTSLTNIVNCMSTRGLAVGGVSLTQKAKLTGISDTLGRWANVEGHYYKDGTPEETVKAAIKVYEKCYNDLKALFG